MACGPVINVCSGGSHSAGRSTWRDLVEDPAPLDPLADADLRALAALLGVLGVADPPGSPGGQ